MKLNYINKFKLISLFILFSSVLVFAQQNPPSTTTTTAIRKSFDSEKITVDNTAGGVGFTSSKINPTCTSCIPSIMQASAVSCTLETADIRIQTSGVTVTSSTGLYVIAGEGFNIYGYNDIAAFKAIRVGGSSGVLNCTYYR